MEAGIGGLISNIVSAWDKISNRWQSGPKAAAETAQKSAASRLAASEGEAAAAAASNPSGYSAPAGNLGDTIGGIANAVAAVKNAKSNEKPTGTDKSIEITQEEETESEGETDSSSDSVGGGSPALPSDEDTKIVKAVWNKKPCDDEWWYDDDLLKAYRNLDSVVFSYNEEGQKLDPSVGNETRSGVIAQQVEREPLLSAAVETDPKTGYKMLDMRQIAASNMAAISEIAKQLEVLKKQIQRITSDEMIRGSN